MTEHDLTMINGDYGSNRQPSSARPIVRLYLAEQQQALREVYEAYFRRHPTVKLLGASGDITKDSLRNAAKALEPNVVLAGGNTLQAPLVEAFRALREECSSVGLVLLFWAYHAEAIRKLRKIPLAGPAGVAYLLKHTIDTLDQLSNLIGLVVQGKVIVDPAVMGGLIDGRQARGDVADLEFAADRSLPRSWGDGNLKGAAAGAWPRDLKPKPRDASGPGSPFQDAGMRVDPRVLAALAYLAASKLPISQPFSEN